MLTANLSRGVAARIEYFLNRKLNVRKDFIISIQAPDFAPLEFDINPKNVVYLTFWDHNNPNHEFAFKPSMAADAAEMIRKARAKRGNLWVNCHAGISRSGAMVEVAHHLGFKVLKHPYMEERFPNPLVYWQMRKQFPNIPELEIKQHDPFWGPMCRGGQSKINFD